VGLNGPEDDGMAAGQLKRVIHKTFRRRPCSTTHHNTRLRKFWAEAAVRSPLHTRFAAGCR
jgi:hypothetical protein